MSNQAHDYQPARPSPLVLAPPPAKFSERRRSSDTMEKDQRSEEKGQDVSDSDTESRGRACKGKRYKEIIAENGLKSLKKERKVNLRGKLRKALYGKWRLRSVCLFAGRGGPLLPTYRVRRSSRRRRQKEKAWSDSVDVQSDLAPKVIKNFSCWTQLSMKFVMLLNLKLLTIANYFLLNIAEHENFSANKYENANLSWHFHIY